MPPPTPRQGVYNYFKNHLKIPNENMTTSNKSINLKPQSKGIKKENPYNEQVYMVDKQTYDLIHVYNPETKRMNQIL